MNMKRVTYTGQAQSFSTAGHVFTRRKSFNDMTEEEAKYFENTVGFIVTDSPKYPRADKTTPEEEKLNVEDSEEVLDGSENEEEDEEDTEEIKAEKKLKKKKLKK